MAAIHLSIWYSYAVLLAICFANFSGTFIAANEDRKAYIVYMGALPSEPEYSPIVHHMSMLQEVVNRSYVGQSMIRTYSRSFNGFAANLSEKEAKKLSAHEHVVSIFPSQTLQLHTTKSWEFMGFSENVHRNLSVEGDVIVGIIDTGIWPESESFNDDGFGPIPKKWKGACKGGTNFTCNKKIIGARYYGPKWHEVEPSARDINGHGSHTASTAAGNNVENASFYGIAKGTARGGVPSARIAVYNACPFGGCVETALMAGFDDAIADGVDIISISIGTSYPRGLTNDVIAIGSFHAAEKGILTVHSAGNTGSNPGVISSIAPWLFTVAASNINRNIISKVVLGNGTVLIGNSVNSFKLNGTQFPVVYGADASKNCSESEAKFCNFNCLDKELVKGKIVLCQSHDNVVEVGTAGALGLISKTDEMDDVSRVFPFAAAVLNDDQQFELVERYYNSTKNPTMNILKSVTTTNLNAPRVAYFSSRGPNIIIPDIMKPDITAPGVDILAAYSPASSPSSISFLDKRSVSYSILSGTSMSCPHVTGASAYVKSFHPDWSPSAIKSALMTTAWRMNATNTTLEAAEFSYGAGHLDPIKAVNPGILYDISSEDYIKMMCGLNITSATKLFGYNITCVDVVPIQPKDLNYPSMTADIGKYGAFTVEFSRRVTNVGLANSTYKATITTTSNCNITVVPNILSFKMLNEQKSFVVTVTGQLANMISASLEWSDGIHTARSPIIVYHFVRDNN